MSIIVSEILICIVTQLQLLLVAQDTYQFRGQSICHSLDCKWKSALQVDMKTMGIDLLAWARYLRLFF